MDRACPLNSAIPAESFTGPMLHPKRDGVSDLNSRDLSAALTGKIPQTTEGLAFISVQPYGPGCLNNNAVPLGHEFDYEGRVQRSIRSSMSGI